MVLFVSMSPEGHSLALQSPRDRLQQFGPTSLTTSELVGLILGTGPANENAMNLAERLLAENGGLVGLARLGLEELTGIPGIGPAKAMQIQAVLDLGRRMTLEVMGARPKITCPADAAQYLMPDAAQLEQEHLRVLLLDTRNHAIAVHEVYKGSLNTSLIRVGEVFREAIRRNSAAVIVAHNHPSGLADPSPEDVAVTRALVEAGKLLDIDVLDHIVVGHGSFVSLKERGLGF